ncbi:hypothetical protein [Luteolibacter pohnpeiensis]|nr:hypothetical protein [Luteolibacter pohnpeiensis]
MKNPASTYQEAFDAERNSIRILLQTQTPIEVAQRLTKNGWPWEWACAAVECIELRENPASLPHGSAANQRYREKLELKANLGLGLLIIGLLFSLFTLVVAFNFGGTAIIAYGAVICGAGLWLNVRPKLKFFPNRRLPKYQPPRDPKVYSPDSY